MNLKSKPISSLQRNFYPTIFFFNDYRTLCKKNSSKSFVCALISSENNIFTYSTEVLDSLEKKEMTLLYLEKIIKSLLWMKGGHSLYIYSPIRLYSQHLKKVFSPQGKYAFDEKFIVHDIFQQPLKIIDVPQIEDVPKSNEHKNKLGGHTDGCRLGFDLGGSDKKICAVKEGKVIFSKSILWNPIEQKDIQWHTKEVLSLLELGASYLPKVDAIGASVPGVCQNNEVLTSSLFKGLSQRDKIASKTLFQEIVKKHWNVPFALTNDGDISAIAGKLLFNKHNLLSIAMGTSQACGYLDAQGYVTSWINEFAFLPIDIHPQAPLDDWSGDHGCGSHYFSQKAVIRLAEQVGFKFDSSLSLAEKLVEIQKNSEDPKIIEIFNNIGVFLAYSLAYYKEFYSFDHLLLLGRVLKGTGGYQIIHQLNLTLKQVFPQISMNILNPKEEDIVHAQALASATLPKLS